MATIQISTDRQCAALKCPADLTLERGAVKNPGFGGLYLEVRSDRDAKRWLYRYRIAGKQCDMTLGNYPALSLADARDKHKEAAELVRLGIDPRQHKAAIKAVNESTLTMQALHDLWLEHLTLAGEVTPQTIQDHAARWNRHLQKPLGNIRVDHLTRAHLFGALYDMRRNAKEQTRKAMSTLNGMMDHCLVRGLTNENPMRLLRPKDFAASTPEGRSRWLTLHELRLLWLAIESKGKEGQGVAATSVLSRSMVGVIQTAILTGCRREEAVGMRWDELDLKAGVWILPPERTKNRTGHTIHLSPLMQEVIEGMRPLNGNSPFVFASPRQQGDTPSPLTVHGVSRAINRLQSPESKSQPEGPLFGKIEAFTLHDLRRTCATHWADTLQLDSRLTELMLNHLPADKLVRTYQRGKQSDRQREGWMRWGEVVARHVAQDPGKVVKLTIRRA